MARAWSSVSTGMVMSSKKAFSGGILISLLNRGPCVTPDVASKITWMTITMTNGISKFVHPIAIPTWLLIHPVMNVEVEKPEKYRVSIVVICCSTWNFSIERQQFFPLDMKGAGSWLIEQTPHKLKWLFKEPLSYLLSSPVLTEVLRSAESNVLFLKLLPQLTQALLLTLTGAFKLLPSNILPLSTHKSSSVASFSAGRWYLSTHCTRIPKAVMVNVFTKHLYSILKWRCMLESNCEQQLIPGLTDWSLFQTTFSLADGNVIITLRPLKGNLHILVWAFSALWGGGLLAKSSKSLSLICHGDRAVLGIQRCIHALLHCPVDSFPSLWRRFLFTHSLLRGEGSCWLIPFSEENVLPHTQMVLLLKC